MLHKSAAPHWFDLFTQWITIAIELAGVLVIAGGILVAAFIFFYHVRNGKSLSDAYHIFRTSLARGILLGLEFLVAADIIATVAINPTLDSLSVLGLIVLIRTFLSFTLETEVEGQWPWQRAKTHGTHGSKSRHTPEVSD